MIKVYGMPTCPYCEYVHEQIVGREDEFDGEKHYGFIMNTLMYYN